MMRKKTLTESSFKFRRWLEKELANLYLERRMLEENSPGKRNYAFGVIDGKIAMIKKILELYY